MQNSSLRQSGEMMLVRAALPEDIPEIMRLAAESETAAHWSEREYDALFAPEAPRRVALVAVEEAGEIAGFVIARCSVDEWEIENIVVEPKVRRKGIGQVLVQEVARRAREHGATDLFLDVRESNLAARGLYQKLGFKEKGLRRGYYQNPDEDALVLMMNCEPGPYLVPEGTRDI